MRVPVSVGVNLMIATLRTSTTVGWEDITLYLIFAKARYLNST